MAVPGSHTFQTRPESNVAEAVSEESRLQITPGLEPQLHSDIGCFALASSEISLFFRACRGHFRYVRCLAFASATFCSVVLGVQMQRRTTAGAIGAGVM